LDDFDVLMSEGSDCRVCGMYHIEVDEWEEVEGQGNPYTKFFFCFFFKQIQWFVNMQ